MSEPVTIALLSVAGVVLTALIGLVARVNIVVSRTRRDAAVTKDQVTNHHSTNMRVEQDERHAENTQALKALAANMDAQHAIVLGEIRALWGKAGSNADRIYELENTQPSRGRHRQ